MGQRRIQLEADCELQERQFGIGHSNFFPFRPGFPCLKEENFRLQRTSPKNCSFSWLLTISETYNQFHLEMFYVAAQENKKEQILRIKSQVSRLLTIKYNSADLSLKFCFRRGWQRGGSNHTSRSIFYRITYHG